MNRLCVFGSIFFTHTPYGILIKYNVKENLNKGNQGEFYMPKVELLSIGKRR